jgi:hypothetical protein
MAQPPLHRTGHPSRSSVSAPALQPKHNLRQDPHWHTRQQAIKSTWRPTIRSYRYGTYHRLGHVDQLLWAGNSRYAMDDNGEEALEWLLRSSPRCMSPYPIHIYSRLLMTRSSAY